MRLSKKVITFVYPIYSSAFSQDVLGLSARIGILPNSIQYKGMFNETHTFEGRLKCIEKVDIPPEYHIFNKYIESLTKAGFDLRTSQW